MGSNPILDKQMYVLQIFAIVMSFITIFLLVCCCICCFISYKYDKHVTTVHQREMRVINDDLDCYYCCRISNYEKIEISLGRPTIKRRNNKDLYLR
jgi:hypothetical protein